MDSIKNKISKINFDSITKIFIILLIIFLILLLIRYLINNKEIELFNVDEDSCKDKYLLNYGNKSISSILVDKDLRYGFFNDINKVKNNYYDTRVSVNYKTKINGKDKQETSINSINSLKLFKVDSFENPVIITPAEFKFVNNDKKYPVLIGGYDFNNVIFLFKINNFTESTNQNYGTIFDNSFFELRLITKDTNSNKKLFNLFLINKFSKDNIGFMLDPYITKIELNKFYYIRISIIDKKDESNESNDSKDVCLTLIELEHDIYSKTLYQKTDSYENSKIKNILIDTSNNSGGILKCENTAIGRKVSQLELSSDVLTNVVPSLNMDFGFIKIGGGKKINIDMMPKPPTTTTTTTQYVESNTNLVGMPNEDLFPDNDYIKNAIIELESYNTYNEDNEDNITENESNYIIKESCNKKINLINLTGILNFINNKISRYESIKDQKKYTSNELIALFHLNYLKKIRNEIKDLIGNLLYNTKYNNNNDDCYISKYFLKGKINTTIKNILEDYITKTFNSKKQNGNSNDFVTSIMLVDELYNTEPKNIENQINDIINTLRNDYNLNIDFTIELINKI